MTFNKNKKVQRLIYPILYIGLLGFVFFGVGDKIIYHNKQDLLSWIPFILIFPIQAILVYKISRTFDLSDKYAKGIVAAAILVTGPSFGIYNQHKQNKELSENGRQTFGVVYKKWKSSKKYSDNQWLLRCSFTVDGKAYSTFSEDDVNNEYKIGDTLHVIYSSNNPENCIISELEKK